MIYQPHPDRCCIQCIEYFPATTQFFNKRTVKKDGLDSTCKRCCSAYQKRRYYDNHTQTLQYHRDWREKHPESIAASLQKYRQTHRSVSQEKARRFRQQFPKRARAAEKKYRMMHPEVVRSGERRRSHAKNSRRKARLSNLPVSFGAADWDRCLDYWNFRCAYCGNPPGFLPEMVLSADHWIPVTSPDCPGTVIENMLPACKSCNSSKHNRDGVEWIDKKFGKRKAAQILARINAYFEWAQAQEDRANLRHIGSGI